MAKRFKDYSELTFTDDFMFCKVMSTNLDLCKEVLELILNMNISRIELVERNRDEGMDRDEGKTVDDGCTGDGAVPCRRTCGENQSARTRQCTFRQLDLDRCPPEIPYPV